MRDNVLKSVLAVLIFLLMASIVFLYGRISHASIETKEIDLGREIFLIPLPQPFYNQDYRIIPENFETKEQPDTTLFYYEEYDVKHTECVRVSDLQMMCPEKIAINVDEEIAKELRFDEHLHSCERMSDHVRECRRK